ncbi:MAG: hypothetical protein D6696_10470, partial [Acidobacteria bacterium]
MTYLSTEQRLFFEAQGYLVLPGALSPSELAAARAAADRAEARWRADPELPGVRRHDLEQVLGILEYDPLFLELLEHPRVFPRVRELLGPDVSMLDHDYFITPPGTTVPHGWHVDLDLQGIDHPRSRLMVKVFYVLEDVPPDGGATLVLPGSHRWGPEVEVPDPELPEDMPGAVKMDLEAGSAYLITGRTLHSAGTNASGVVRRLLIFNYGHKWMRIWQSYEPSAELLARATTPMRRQLLGLSDPYGLDDAG